MTPDRSNPRPEILLWHDLYHERLGPERLYFFRLSFSPSYDRSAIYDRIDAFYAELEIASHIAYESLGEYDLLLRLWIPSRYNVEEVELQLWEALRDLDIWGINYLSCHTHVHWAGHDVAFDADAMPLVDEDVVREVNAFNVAQWAGTLCPRDARIQSLVDDGILAPVALDARGIRFYVIFNHPTFPFTPPRRKAALSMIRVKCEEIVERWRSEPDVTSPQVSIYEGGGTMTDFLIMVRAPHPAFHRFARELVLGLRETQLSEVFGMRPFTHVLADRMFSDFVEQLPVVAPAHDDLADLLSRDESATLEFKATLGVNFRSLMATGRRGVDDAMLHAVAKALCGLLNSPGGGTLVIGVLEVRRELEKASDPGAYLKRLQAEFGYEPPSGAAATEMPNAIIGIEAEVGPDGPFADVDKYVQRLTDTLRSSIDPNPLPFVGASIVEASNGRHVCLVRAKPADHWFYVKTRDRKHAEFVVREAVSSRVYVGAESDLYKQAHPRRGLTTNG
jgi:hypothetical protein